MCDVWKLLPDRLCKHAVVLYSRTLCHTLYCVLSFDTRHKRVTYESISYFTELTLWRCNGEMMTSGSSTVRFITISGLAYPLNHPLGIPPMLWPKLGVDLLSVSTPSWVWRWVGARCYWTLLLPSGGGLSLNQWRTDKWVWLCCWLFSVAAHIVL